MDVAIIEVHTAQIIQYKPPASFGVLAFHGSVMHRGLCALRK